MIATMRRMTIGMPAPRPALRAMLWAEELVELGGEFVGEEIGESGVGLGVAEVGAVVRKLSVSTSRPMIVELIK